MPWQHVCGEPKTHASQQSCIGLALLLAYQGKEITVRCTCSWDHRQPRRLLHQPQGVQRSRAPPPRLPGRVNPWAPASSSAFPWAEGAIGPAQPTRLVPTNTPAAILAPMGPYQVRLGSAHDCMLSTPSCCIAGDCHQGEISRGQNPNDCRQLAEPVHLRMRLHSSGATTGRAHLLGISSNPANAAALSHVRCSS